MGIIDLMQSENNLTFTENGAITNKSTFDDVLDFFANGGGLKDNPEAFLQYFINAYNTDKQLAIKVLFYLRDVRGGQGIREGFRKCIQYLSDFAEYRVLSAIIYNIAFYGRWDDCFCLLETKCSNIVFELLCEQIVEDLDNISAKKNISLLGKWLKSENTSSKESRRIAKIIRKGLNLSSAEYRRLLSKLRAYIDITERKLSFNKVKEIEYSRVPSKAMDKYKKAFIRKDGDRYNKYIVDVLEGKNKINSSTLYPYEICHTIRTNEDDLNVLNACEAQWKALPNYMNEPENSIAVVDVSGSMGGGRTKTDPINVSVSLGLYFAERNQGIFNNKIITFSANPTIFDITGQTIERKLESIFRSPVGYNTNIQAVFNLILNTAIKHKLPESEMIKKIYIISDMEFDSHEIDGKTNFEAIKYKYQESGYEMPKLVFWNVENRNKQVPVTKDENGTYLVSGCSPAILRYAMNTQTVTPYELMLEVINSSRYDRLTF